jgi:hypothetical protein
MLCSHRLPYEQRCPFCFEAAMEVERLRLGHSREPALLPSGSVANDRPMRSRNNCRSGNERRRMGRGSITASGCPDRRRAGGVDSQRASFSGLGQVVDHGLG